MKPTNPSQQPAEQELIANATKGNLDAFNQLVIAYQDMAYHHGYTLLSDAASAEDAAQESFIKAFQNIGGFRGGSFRGWLLKIVTNSAYDLMRRSRRHPTQPLFPEDDDGEEIESPTWLADPSASVQDAVEQGEFSKDIYKMLDELPEVYKSVLTLIDLYELDYTEAAEALRVPIGTVKSRLARARMQMKEKLQTGFEYSISAKPCVSVNAVC
ncbi:MAG TPA: RNA polymerase sigma factor [Anaerolineales bacterium]|nr:RNA polymerase sigma factor [Anaerolineales bacterium]